MPGAPLLNDSKEAQAQFVEALYEIQRGYNLDANGIDDCKQDRSICFGGTINKLVEKLNSIHPEVNVNFSSATTVSMKLPIVVQEQALKYLNSLDSNYTTREILIQNFKDNGVESIWQNIEADIRKELFEEFKLWNNLEETSLREMVEAGQYVDLEKMLSRLEIKESSLAARAQAAANAPAPEQLAEPIVVPQPAPAPETTQEEAPVIHQEPLQPEAPVAEAAPEQAETQAQVLPGFEATRTQAELEEILDDAEELYEFGKISFREAEKHAENWAEQEQEAVDNFILAADEFQTAAQKYHSLGQSNLSQESLDKLDNIRQYLYTITYRLLEHKSYDEADEVRYKVKEHFGENYFTEEMLANLAKIDFVKLASINFVGNNKKEQTKQSRLIRNPRS